MQNHVERACIVTKKTNNLRMVYFCLIKKKQPVKGLQWFTRNGINLTRAYIDLLAYKPTIKGACKEE